MISQRLNQKPEVDRVDMFRPLVNYNLALAYFIITGNQRGVKDLLENFKISDDSARRIALDR